MTEIDLTKDPSECTEEERWEQFYYILALGLVEAWREGRLDVEPVDEALTA